MGEVLKVTFNIEDQTIEAVGRVVWATETDPITLDVGIEFIHVEGDAQRLLETASGE